MSGSKFYIQQKVPLLLLLHLQWGWFFSLQKNLLDVGPHLKEPNFKGSKIIAKWSNIYLENCKAFPLAMPFGRIWAAAIFWITGPFTGEEKI